MTDSLIPPTIGRVVHYVYLPPTGAAGLIHAAAIITRVHTSASVALTVFAPDGRIWPKSVVPYDPAHMQDGSWHWPERNEAPRQQNRTAS